MISSFDAPPENLSSDRYLDVVQRANVELSTLFQGKKILMYASGGPNDPNGGVSQVYSRVAAQFKQAGALVSLLVKDWKDEETFIYYPDLFQANSTQERFIQLLEGSHVDALDKAKSPSDPICSHRAGNSPFTNTASPTGK